MMSVLGLLSTYVFWVLPWAYSYDYHNAPRLSRILQRVEYGSKNQSYLCSACQNTHPARPCYGLNICVSTSRLTNYSSHGALCLLDT